MSEIEKGEKDKNAVLTQSSVLSPQSSSLSPQSSSSLVIAIDGPSGSGKSTVGKALARRLGYQYIDSGAIYRAVGLKALSTNTALDAAAAVAALTRNSRIELEGDPGHLQVHLDGRNVTQEIRLPDVSHASSVVATIPEVREAVVEKLREMARAGGVVMDGRDIGTRVFPNAQVKLFLDASLDVRARRRCEEERGRGRDVAVDQIRGELDERDRRDRERSATPLIRADDAIFVDTSDMPLEQVVEHALEIVRMRS